jgi:hypothetical protein
MASKTVHNERVKLTATFLNGVGIATFAIGGLTTAVQALRVIVMPPELVKGTALVVFACAGVAFTLHLFARKLLGELVE